MTITADVALSRQIALQNQLDVLSNNIANQGNAGYEEEHVIFAEYLGEENPGGNPSYNNDITTYREQRLGNMVKTGNPLHIGRQVKGYFGVQTPDGPRYTGNGAFTRSPEGLLIDQHGNPVLSMDGGEIVIPAESATIDISTDGTISDEQGVIARIGLFAFDNPYLLNKQGDTLMQTDQAAIPMEAEAVVLQGAYNDSNGNPIKNTTKLIEVTKLYAMNQKIIDQEFTLAAKAIDLMVTPAPAA